MILKLGITHRRLYAILSSKIRVHMIQADLIVYYNVSSKANKNFKNTEINQNKIVNTSMTTYPPTMYVSSFRPAVAFGWIQDAF